MNALVLSLAAIAGVSISMGSIEETRSTVVVDKDPGTIVEFSELVAEAAEKGAVRVKFPSGEWNWYCTCRADLPKKEKLAKWSFNDECLRQEELDKWLDLNNIHAVHISMSKDCEPDLLFQVESLLRKRKVVYWCGVVTNSSNQKQLIRLWETDGLVSSTSEFGSKVSE